MRRYLLRINVFMSHDFSRISQHLDFVSKSLKTFIWFFIGTLNASTWCSISRCWLVGMKYELLLMRLRSRYSRFRLHNILLSPKCKWVALWSNMTNKLTTCIWPRLFFVDWESPPLYYDNYFLSMIIARICQQWWPHPIKNPVHFIQNPTRLNFQTPFLRGWPWLLDL